MAVQYMLETQLLDVVTSYLYGPLDTDIYIKHISSPNGLHSEDVKGIWHEQSQPPLSSNDW